ncbi:hypothetical protein ACWPOB_05845 [Rhodococcus sp. 2H158]|nr:hypothetical protein GQ85_27455 [Rhodococcus rhodochrous]
MSHASFASRVGAARDKLFDLAREIAAIVEAAEALDRESLPLADEIAVTGLVDALTDVSGHLDAATEPLGEAVWFSRHLPGPFG